MQVILMEDLANLGTQGSVVTVKDGYARNYLIPRGLAAEANTRNVGQLEHQRRMVAARRERMLKDAQHQAKQIEHTQVTIPVKVGDEDRLFGAVTTTDIAEALAKHGVTVDRRRIHLDEPIKVLGAYTVTVRVGPDVNASLNVVVVKEK